MTDTPCFRQEFVDLLPAKIEALDATIGEREKAVVDLEAASLAATESHAQAAERVSAAKQALRVAREGLNALLDEGALAVLKEPGELSSYAKKLIPAQASVALAERAVTVGDQLQKAAYLTSLQCEITVLEHQQHTLLLKRSRLFFRAMVSTWNNSIEIGTTSSLPLPDTLLFAAPSIALTREIDVVSDRLTELRSILKNQK